MRFLEPYEGFMSAKPHSKAKKSAARDVPSKKKNQAAAPTIRSIDVEEFVRRLRAETSADDAAEAMYKRALEVDPKYAPAMNNYGAFLSDVRKDYDAAEAMYKRALEADPQDANNISSYAVFLQNIRKDYDVAEEMFKRALEADSKHANNIGNYALFLSDIRKDNHAADAMNRRALEANPKHAVNRAN
jgi:Tfp pilus assembly protein PilF